MSDRTCSIEGCEKPVQTRGWCATHYMRWYTTGDVSAASPIKTHRSTCDVAGCDRKHYGFGYCRMHYRRWKATGEPGPVDPIRNTDRDGCQVDGCDRPHKGKGYCRLHYQRWVTTGDPLGMLPRSNPVNWGPANGNWKGAEVTYITIHQRIIRSRGKAAEHNCVKCGKPASQWAYDYSDPNALRDERGCPYSTDPSHYMPLCASCHKRFDLAQSEVAHGQHRRGASSAARGGT